MTRILAIRLSALGDIIHTIPAVVAMREALSEVRVGWVIEKRYRELIEIVARVEAIPVSMKRWGRRPLASHREMRDARRAIRSYDVTVDFQGLIKSAALACFARARVRYGFDRDAIRERAALLFTNRRVSVDQSKHVIEWNLQLARAVVEERQPRLSGHAGLLVPPIDFAPFTADPERKLDDYRDSIVLLPGAGKPEKQWPVERFRELARLIGGKAVAVWGPGEDDLARATGARMTPQTNLRELAHVLQHAALVIGGDTGPLHLAAALGTRVVGLYGPTSPRRNGPYGQVENCISADETTRSMQTIETGEVMKTLERILSS